MRINVLKLNFYSLYVNKKYIFMPTASTVQLTSSRGEKKTILHCV